MFKFYVTKSGDNNQLVPKIETQSINWLSNQKELKEFIKKLPFEISSASFGLPSFESKKEIICGVLIFPLPNEWIEYVNTKWIKGLPKEFVNSQGVHYSIYIQMSPDFISSDVLIKDYDPVELTEKQRIEMQSFE